MRQIFIFVDGLGLAPAAPDNPVAPDVCPFLCRLIAENAKPIDACLGVAGLPQSATGQATLFTGRNAAAYMGRHVEGFPGPTLRKFVEQDNVFLAVKAMGRRGRFADGYMAETVDEIRNRRFRSVTTTAALTVPEVISLKADILANQAVLHDLTRAAIVSKGYNGPLVTPAATTTRSSNISSPTAPAIREVTTRPRRCSALSTRFSPRSSRSPSNLASPSP